jgi:hypothetical protein
MKIKSRRTLFVLILVGLLAGAGGCWKSQNNDGNEEKDASPPLVLDTDSDGLLDATDTDSDGLPDGQEETTDRDTWTGEDCGETCEENCQISSLLSQC